MLISPSRIFRRPSRRITATLMALAYFLIVLLPLAPAALHSKSVTHAVTGECSGDCKICGCSPESSARKTCCCAKKIQMKEQALEDADTPECCKKKQTQATVIRCGCPCGERKQIALTGIGSFEVIPTGFSESFTQDHKETSFNTLPHRLTSRYVDPPEQPPQLNTIS
jgi:hypothetical protein